MVISFAKFANIKHEAMPIIVGTNTETIVHFQLPVSFFIVSRVVEQGQCMREKSMVLMAVSHVQPLFTNSAFRAARLSIDSILPCAIYAIIIMGMTISLAGKPRMKANRITPSRPRRWAKGFRKSEV